MKQNIPGVMLWDIFSCHRKAEVCYHMYNVSVVKKDEE